MSDLKYDPMTPKIAVTHPIVKAIVGDKLYGIAKKVHQLTKGEVVPEDAGPDSGQTALGKALGRATPAGSVSDALKK